MSIMNLETLSYKVQSIKGNKLAKNYILNTTDGAFFALAMGMVPLGTVLQYFISGFVSQKSLIGLLSFINILLMFSPQILVSKKLEQLRRFKPFLLLTGISVRVLWLLMGLNVLLFADKNPILFTVLFYVLYSLIGLASSFTNITWLNFIVKIIPGNYRGRFLGIRSTVAGIFESTGSILMGFIVKSLPYPMNYGILFLAVFALTLVSLGFVALSEEQESVREERERSGESYIRKMLRTLKTDRNFTYYLITVALIGGLGKMAFAFQIIFAKEKLGILEQQVSYATFILLVSQTIGYLIWGILGDRYGFKLTLEISAVIFVPSILLTYLMSSLPVFYAGMALFGLAQSARNVNENNLAINLCRSEEKQPLYIGLRNLLMGPVFAFNPLIAGAICDLFGYAVLFIFSTIFMLAGFWMMVKYVKEYR